MPSISERFKRSWNAFLGRDPTDVKYLYGSSYRPDRYRLTRNNSQTIVASIYNRIAVDVASIEFKHVRTDSSGRYKEDIQSYLNNCLTVEANIDQTGRAFIQDVVMSMIDEGCVVIVPTDCEINGTRTRIVDGSVYSMRTGRVVTWYPSAVKVDVYNERIGRREEIVVPKSLVAIIENPFYSIMNEPNSTLQRLIRALNRMDAINDQNSSGKIDLIIQLPYVIKSELRKKEAEKRRKELEDQLIDSKYGIGYIDGTEKITQLNRAVDNTLWEQVKELTTQLYNQLGLTTSIFDGTADEQTLINYNNRTIEPFCAAITGAMERSFLTQTARTQGQAIRYFRDPFKLVPVSQIADIADKFTRNEILSSNELRAEVGFKPVDDPRADELRNKNLNQSTQDLQAVDDSNVPSFDEKTTETTNIIDSSPENNESLDALLKQLNEIDVTKNPSEVGNLTRTT